MIELNGCPFCGGVDVSMKTSKSVSPEGLTMILCWGCGLTASFQGSEKKHLAVAAWNRREPEPKQTLYYETIGTSVRFMLREVWYDAVIIDGPRTDDGIINVRLSDGRTAWCPAEKHFRFVKPIRSSAEEGEKEQ